MMKRIIKIVLTTKIINMQGGLAFMAPKFFVPELRGDNSGTLSLVMLTSHNVTSKKKNRKCNATLTILVYPVPDT
jgi:hypothetical protein